MVQSKKCIEEAEQTIEDAKLIVRFVLWLPVVLTSQFMI